VRWHTKRVGRPPVSAHAHHLICQVAKIAKALELPQAFALAKYRNGLRPQPVHNKEDHHVPLDVLMQVANANIAEGRLTLVPQWRDEHPEARQPRFPGARRATRFARGLMLRLLLRHPKRQRNIRELQFRHLSRTNGHCTVVIRGADLKIGWRGGEVNEDRFDLADDPTLLALFEEWLTVHRPKLPGAATSPYIFLTHTGRPHTQGSLRHALGYDVYQRTGIRWFPHMIRTTWATTYLDEEADYDVAAEALGDKPETVMQTYRKSTREVLQAKALAFYKKTFKR